MRLRLLVCPLLVVCLVLPAPSQQPDDAGCVPITLHDALSIAVLSNLDIAQSKAVLEQAEAALLRARLIGIPNGNLTSTYIDHEGNIQRTEGNIVKVNRNSLFYGLGPTLSVGLSDALFIPRIARDLEAAREAGVARVTNDTLLTVVDAYVALLRARRRLARVQQVLEALTSEQKAASRANSKGLLPLIQDFVEVGGKEAFRSDLARVQVEVYRRREEGALILQEFQVASAELARLLNLDPTRLLCPADDFRQPLPFPGEPWLERSQEDLVAFALQNRPEIAETQSEIQAASDRVRQAKLRPWLPNLNASYLWGDFGGGPNTNPPILQRPTRAGDAPRLVAQPGFGPSNVIAHLNTRADFEVTVFWRLQNMGFGNMAEVREMRAVQQQAFLRRLQAQNRVAAQVVATQESTVQGRERFNITRESLFDDAGRPNGAVFQSLRLNFDRIRGAEGRPLEVLDSVRGLNDMLEAYANALSEYDRARYRLLFVLGLPPNQVLCAPLPPAPNPDAGAGTLTPVPAEKGGELPPPRKAGEDGR